MSNTGYSRAGAVQSRSGVAIQSPGRCLAARYSEVRSFTRRLCGPLATEDYVVQSMPDVSPTKWHLAHTTWFFETFLLPRLSDQLQPFDPHYKYLFNSYYNAVGAQFPRPRRGVLSRPTVEEVWKYREYVDRAVADRLAGLDGEKLAGLTDILELGLNHEQQHQELILTDLKHVFSCNPLNPVYLERAEEASRDPGPMEWFDYPGGLHWIGHEGPGFAFDNEGPRHQVFLRPFCLGSRLVTNREYLAFIEADGYRRPEFWLSAGWDAAQTAGWNAPLYWERHSGGWQLMTLSGLRDLDPNEPVCHVSYYEADAYMRWAGARLPLESEWEVASAGLNIEGNFADGGRFHPAPMAGEPPTAFPSQVFGDAWEWTASPYSAYPGYRPAAGALGEYNGKFMCNQQVLRGGSCATPASHIRATYRNFFPPDVRWQFAGIRPAKDTS